jgi:hypothetical protein
MTTLIALIVLWNASAVTIGVLGAARPTDRERYARWVGRQTLVAGGLTLALVCLGAAGTLLPEGELGRAVRGARLLLGALVSAGCTLVPMTVMVLLSVRPRRSRAAPSSREPPP